MEAKLNNRTDGTELMKEQEKTYLQLSISKKWNKGIKKAFWNENSFQNLKFSGGTKERKWFERIWLKRTDEKKIEGINLNLNVIKPWNFRLEKKTEPQNRLDLMKKGTYISW